MIKNIIFDLGNVLLNFKPKEFMRRFTDDEIRINIFVSKIISPEIWFKIDRGDITWDEAKRIYFKKYPEEMDLLKPFLEQAWEMLTPIQTNIQILKELKKMGYRVYVLSSFIKEAFDYVHERYDFFSLLDGCIISYQERLIKPEKEIYERLIKRYKLLPEESVYIDDHEFILKPAKELGMKTIHFTPSTNLREEFLKLEVRI